MKNKIPKIPKKLPGTFWGITTFFNPIGYKNKLENYKIFRESSKKQGLKLLTVELAFGNKPFELKKEDAEILIQIRAKNNNILWQKERLINIGIKNLPKDCDKFAWLDADIIFCNNNWIKETCKLLESYAIVQPFDSSIRLSKGIFYLNPNEIPFGSEIEMERFKSCGVIFSVSEFGKEILKKRVKFHGLPGFAWAARKLIFEKEGIFDKAQCSDCLMMHMFYNKKLNLQMNNAINKKVKQSLYKWTKKISKKIRGGVYYTSGTILHLWHGKPQDRYYHTCDEILMKYDFDPYKDIKIDPNGIWIWHSNKPKLHKEIRGYFLMRNEEDSFLHNIFFPTVFKSRVINYFDRMIGLIGLHLKKEYPGLYIFLKKIFK